MIDVTRLSDAILKELYKVMDERRKSCARNPAEETEYQTQSRDWQSMFKEVENEMKRRGFL